MASFTQRNLRYQNKAVSNKHNSQGEKCLISMPKSGLEQNASGPAGLCGAAVVFLTFSKTGTIFRFLL